MSLSNYAKNKILNHIYTATAYPSPNASLHLALFTADPTAEGDAANEVDVGVVDTSYTRQVITFDTSAAPKNGQSLNNLVCTFPPVVYGSGNAAYTVSHIAIYDASTLGNMLSYGVLSAPVIREASKSLTFDIGTILMTLDNEVV